MAQGHLLWSDQWRVISKLPQGGPEKGGYTIDIRLIDIVLYLWATP